MIPAIHRSERCLINPRKKTRRSHSTHRRKRRRSSSRKSTRVTPCPSSSTERRGHGNVDGLCYVSFRATWMSVQGRFATAADRPQPDHRRYSTVCVIAAFHRPSGVLGERRFHRQWSGLIADCRDFVVHRPQSQLSSAVVIGLEASE